MTIRQLREFPGVRRLEDKAILDPRYDDREGFDEALDAIAKDLFGVTTEDVEDWLDPYETDEEGYFVDLRDVETDPEFARRTKELNRDFGESEGTIHDLSAYCSRNGWDVCSEEGLPLNLLRDLKYPLLAAIAGVAGARLPDGGTEDLAAWEAKLHASAKPGSHARSHTTPISEEERQRRNKEAKLSTVWRPQR